MNNDALYGLIVQVFFEPFAATAGICIVIIFFVVIRRYISGFTKSVK